MSVPESCDGVAACCDSDATTDPIAPEPEAVPAEAGRTAAEWAMA
jgi:hypothetical protein